MDHLQCRICLEPGTTRFTRTYCCGIRISTDRRKQLVAPCTCRGTQRWVHRSCLDEWRSTHRRNAKKCRECRYRYQLGGSQTQWHKVFLYAIGVKMVIHMTFILCLISVAQLDQGLGLLLLPTVPSFGYMDWSYAMQHGLFWIWESVLGLARIHLVVRAVWAAIRLAWHMILYPATWFVRAIGLDWNMWTALGGVVTWFIARRLAMDADPSIHANLYVARLIILVVWFVWIFVNDMRYGAKHPFFQNTSMRPVVCRYSIPSETDSESDSGSE